MEFEQRIAIFSGTDTRPIRGLIGILIPPILIEITPFISRTMKPSLILIAIFALCFIVRAASPDFLSVGEDFGKSWIQQHGTQPNATENKTSLWSWGNAPKGYAIYNGKPIPPGSGPQWYYPSQTTNNTPIITNSTALNSMYQDPWVLAQFTGQPVMIINTSAGPLF